MRRDGTHLVTGFGPVVGSDGVELDQIAVTGLSATGHHGVFDHERQAGQPFGADVVLHLDTRAAAASDDLTATADYGAIGDLVVAELAGDPVDLIETVAERIAAGCLAAAPTVAAIDVVVHKPQAPLTVPFEDVQIRIRRRR